MPNLQCLVVSLRRLSSFSSFSLGLLSLGQSFHTAWNLRLAIWTPTQRNQSDFGKSYFDHDDYQVGLLYLTLPLDLPILLAIFFRFFCHSCLVKSKPHRIEAGVQIEAFLFSSSVQDNGVMVALGRMAYELTRGLISYLEPWKRTRKPLNEQTTEVP